MRTVARAPPASPSAPSTGTSGRDELVEAITPRLRARASTPMADDVEGLPEYIRRLFTTFDQNAALVRTLITASWAPTQRTRSANLAALRRIVDAASRGRARRGRPARRPRRRCERSTPRRRAYLSDCGFTVQASIHSTRCNG
ncbi:MAG: hypothetical protein H6722_01410 [Sandaracinus sp.]|nr:hypothetical protein [Sandaracinus sp.]